MGRLALLAVIALGASVTQAQETSPALAERPIAESAQRIGREVWPTDASSFSIDEEGRARFRTTVTESLPPPPWQLKRDFSITPARGAISHAEMVRMMTPQEFSTPLISTSVDPGDLYNGFKRAWRDWQERRIHERVMRELEELERLRVADEESK